MPLGINETKQKNKERKERKEKMDPNKLKIACSWAGCTLVQLSFELSCTRQHLYDLMKPENRFKIRISEALEISKALGVPVKGLLRNDVLEVLGIV